MKMRAVDLIVKKRDGGELTRDEIRFFIRGFTNGEIPDYQASAWAMAVIWRGMSPRETADLTEAMVDSGERLDLSDVVSIAVDKHSTGGVGDKTTLAVQPVVAACGVPVGKMSGKALSFTGGTLDKMESFAGFRIDLSTEEFKAQLARIGLVLCSATIDIAPADRKLYALRDVTGTVPSIPLIASSVMSKKIAAGAQAIVLDVKVGLGAFMQDVSEGIALAHALVDIGRIAHRKVVALISDMNQPLGNAVGNALEVKEALDTLRGYGPTDFRLHCLEVAGHMLVLAGKAAQLEAGKGMASEALENGSGLSTFRQLVQAQGGDVGMVDDPARLPEAPVIEAVPSPQSGYIRLIDAKEIGLTAMELGAGRKKKEDKIDHSVGIVLHRKVGDQVRRGDPLLTVHAQDHVACEAAIRRTLAAYRFSDLKVDPYPLFYETITSG
jgi:pyrimidine-nucleoside phosphorylase